MLAQRRMLEELLCDKVEFQAFPGPCRGAPALACVSSSLQAAKRMPASQQSISDLASAWAVRHLGPGESCEKRKESRNVAVTSPLPSLAQFGHSWLL